MFTLQPLTAPDTPPVSESSRYEKARRAAPSEDGAHRRLLIATDGMPQADSAVRFGDTLARRDGLAAELLAVYLPLPVFHPEAPIAPYESLQLLLEEELRECVELQRARTAIDASPWPVSIAVGNPAETIADVASARGAELIVLGIGSHGAKERLLGRETALQVMRVAGVPVLAVAPGCDAPPRAALVAVDFSESSVAAARVAIKFLGREGTLYLVHVAPRIPVPFAGSGAEQHYGDPTFGPFDALLRTLIAPSTVRFVPVTLSGDVAKELLTFAEETGVELIAVGSHGRGALVRAFVGSVSTQLVRGADCSVLVVPPAYVSA